MRVLIKQKSNIPPVVNCRVRTDEGCVEIEQEVVRIRVAVEITSEDTKELSGFAKD